MSPTSAQLLQQDCDALESAFQLQRSISPEELHCYAVHHNAGQLLALGLIAESRLGRFALCYVPAGQMASRLGVQPSGCRELPAKAGTPNLAPA